MSIRQIIENSPVIVHGTVAVAAFLGGWAAHYVVQTASGQTAVSIERAKLAENFAPERESLLARNATLERERAGLERELAALKSAAAATSASTAGAPASSRVRAAGASDPVSLPAAQPAKPNASPQQIASRELPVKIGEMHFDPNHRGDYKVGEKIVIYVDYIIEPGRTMPLWIQPTSKKLSYKYESSEQLTGSGRLSRFFFLTEPGVVDSIAISGGLPDGSVRTIKIWDIYPLSVK